MTTTITTENGFELRKIARGDYLVADVHHDRWAGEVVAHIDFSEIHSCYMGLTIWQSWEQTMRARNLHDIWLMVLAQIKLVEQDDRRAA